METITVAGNELSTILEIAEKLGLSIGVVSTARIAHATPAACYAHTADRDWEDDSNLPADAKAADFPDIVRQLIEFPFGDGLEIAPVASRRSHSLASKYHGGSGICRQIYPDRAVILSLIEVHLLNESPLKRYNAIDYKHIDYADIGDRHSDPFIKNLVHNHKHSD